LVQTFKTRLEAIAARQIHTEDIRALYSLLPRDHDMLKWIARYIGERWVDPETERPLKAKGPLKTLMAECKEFGEDVEKVIEEWKAKKQLESEAERVVAGNGDGAEYAGDEQGSGGAGGGADGEDGVKEDSVGGFAFAWN
jgi:hypothetical protein